MSIRTGDITRPPDLQVPRGTGPGRVRRPLYVDYLPPCNQACPAGENIQAWLAMAQEGRFREAWQILVEDNPMPAVHGRVCYHPCEDHCNRNGIDQAVSIHGVERFLGDMALREGWPVEYEHQPTGKRVLVVGAGPSGLSAAYQLRRLGHEVEVREAGPVPGGMMQFGIPAYRMPRDILRAEVQRIQDMGVSLALNHAVRDLWAEKQSGGFDAVFVAVGAHVSRHTDIPARDAGRILDAVSFLRDVDSGAAPRLGRRVAIYGGGNTAMDAARVAKRLGADEALVIYRRDRTNMPAHQFEVEEAEQEGITINWLRTIKGIEGSTFTVEVMELDEQGRPHATGRTETLQADSLILALGQNVDTGFMRQVPGVEFKPDGTVVVGEDMMTGCAGLFAGGDMVPAERTVTTAVGHGKRAARHIDAFLRGERHQPAAKNPPAAFERLHLWFLTDADRRHQKRLDPTERARGFDEVKAGLSDAEALYEAQRCLSCGNCFECDGCYGSCPDHAVIKLGPGKRYRFDYDRCTGCGVCFEQCPCGAIDMIPEPA